MLLGFALALCYFAKPNGFAVSIGALFTLFVSSRSGRRVSYQIGIAASVFVALSVPFVVLMSKHVGRVSIGEAGIVNYLVWVNQSGSGQEIGPAMVELIQSGTLVHPPQVLLRKPLAVEFVSPLGGVYPWHDDFSYWIAGAKVHFKLREQVNAVLLSCLAIEDLVPTLGAVLGGVFSLFLFAFARGKKRNRLDPSQWWLITWSLLVCGTFALVHLESRYLEPFLVFLSIVAFRAAMGIVERDVEIVVVLAVSFALILPAAVDLRRGLGHMVRDAAFSTRRTDDGVVIAGAIRSLGVNAGDYVAVVGSGYSVISAARLARVRIMVEIPDADAFWHLGEIERSELNRRLADVHVKALLTTDVTQRSDDPTWYEVKGLRSSHFRISPLLRPLNVAYH